MSDDELKRELRELVEVLGKLCENHGKVLERHETNLVAAPKAVTNHASAIEDLRTNFRELGEHIREQDRIMLRVLHALAIDDDVTHSAAPN
jgi:hypothetical protein